MTLRFLMMAGDRALDFDIGKAASHFRKALELSPVGQPGWPRIMRRLAEASGQAGRFVEAEQELTAAIDGFTVLGDAGQAGSAMVNLLYYRGEAARCRKLLKEAVVVLEREAPSAGLAAAYAEMSGDRMLSGSFAEAMEWSDRALELATSLGLDDQMVRTLGIRGAARSCLGDLGGLGDLRQALERSLALGLGRQTAVLYNNLGEQLWPVEGPAVALNMYRAGIEFAERRGIAEEAMGIRGSIGGPLFDLGAWDELLRVADEVVSMVPGAWRGLRPRGMGHSEDPRPRLSRRI